MVLPNIYLLLSLGSIFPLGQSSPFLIYWVLMTPYEPLSMTPQGCTATRTAHDAIRASHGSCTSNTGHGALRHELTNERASSGSPHKRWYRCSLLQAVTASVTSRGLGAVGHKPRLSANKSRGETGCQGALGSSLFHAVGSPRIWSARQVKN